MTLRPLKNSLREANGILQPPQPLPTTPIELAKRLGIKTSFSHTTEGLQLQVGKRCLEILKEIQEWLEREYWPVAERGGLVASDFLLGTADLRLIRSLCSHAIDFFLLPLSIEFHETSPNTTEDLRDELEYANRSLLLLLFTTPPPVTAPGPSTTPNLPPTVIAQTLVAKHLPCVYLSATLLAYAPTIERPVYRVLRSDLSRTWHKLPPALVISTLGSAIRLRQVKAVSAENKTGWSRKWPTYVPGRLGWQMAAVVRAPGGIRAIMENIFGENAILQNGRGVDTQKLDMVARAVTENPAPSDPSKSGEWVPRTLDRLFEIIHPPPGIPPSPPLFINAACYCVFRLYLIHYWPVTDHLDKIMRVPLRAYMRDRKTDSTEHYEPPPELVKATIVIKALSIHTPFNPDFIDYIVGEYLIPLVSLRQHLIANSTHPDAPIEISTSTSDKPNQAKEDNSELPETIHQLVVTWARDVELDTGVRRVIEAVRSGYAEVQEMADTIMEAERPELPRAIVKRIRHWEAWVVEEERRRIDQSKADNKKLLEQAEERRNQEEKAKAEVTEASNSEEGQVGLELKIGEESTSTDVDAEAEEEQEDETIHTIHVKDEDEEDEEYKKAELEEIGSEEEDDGGSVREELDGDLKTPSMDLLAQVLADLLGRMHLDVDADTKEFEVLLDERHDLTNHAMKVHKQIETQGEDRFPYHPDVQK